MAPSLPEALPRTPLDPQPPHGLVRNQTIDILLEHRTIRAFTDEPLGEDMVATLLDVARHTSTSTFYQQMTVVRIKNPAIRQTIYEASGQPYVGGDRGELFIFVVDLSRNARIREAAGKDLKALQSAHLFMQGAADVMLAVQNTVVAAESLGLGAVILGSVGGDPESVIEALQLPKYTFPLVGLLVGYPNQKPQLKPRLPREVTTSVDTYPDFEADWYVALMEEYDQTIQTYYDLREDGKRQDSFTNQILVKPGRGKSENVDLLAALHEQKLCLH